MREIRTSGLMRGKEVGGHCLCALIPWLPSLLYSKTPNPAVIDSRYSWRGSARLLRKMILPIPDFAKPHAIACQRVGAVL